MLEVLGAAALLAFVYIALARSEIEGLRSEQESNRRLQASLLADARLADLELQLAAGTAPALGASESADEEPFRVRTEVRAFEPPPPREDLPRGGPREGSLAARHAEHQVDPDAPSLFAKPKPGTSDPPLRTIEIVVSWDEGVYERQVRRTSFVLDPAAAEALLTQAQAAAAPPEQKTPEDEGKPKKPKSPPPPESPERPELPEPPEPPR